MSDTKLGQLPPEDAQRDAIHIAIAPVVASCQLQPGQHVGLDKDGEADDLARPLIGIVDPFLTRNVPTGSRFYLCLYQQTVTGMRHHWAHPAFSGEPPPRNLDALVERSRQWIRDYAERLSEENGEVSYEQLIEACKTGYLGWGQEINVYKPDPSLAVHYEIITGIKSEEVYFRCAC